MNELSNASDLMVSATIKDKWYVLKQFSDSLGIVCKHLLGFSMIEIIVI